MVSFDIFAGAFFVASAVAGLVMLTIGATGMFGSLLRTAGGGPDGLIMRARADQSAHAFFNAMGIVLFSLAAACAEVLGNSGFDRAFAIAHIVLFAALYHALSVLAQMPISVSVSYILLGAVQGIVVYAMSFLTFSSDMVALCFFICFYCACGGVFYIKCMWMGAGQRGNRVQRSANAVAIFLATIYAIVVLVVASLHYGGNVYGSSTYMWIHPGVAFGFMVAIAVCGGVSSLYWSPTVEVVVGKSERRKA